MCRIRESTRWIVRRDYRISKADKSFITFDQKVILNKCKVPVRLVVFEDEHGRCYHVVTNCWNQSAVEIAQIYKQRWLIELFFKWMKQHLRLIQVFSYSPEGIWNQMYLALIAFALCRLIHLRTQTSKTVWDVLQWIRIYAHAQWKVFQEALHRKPTRTSRGRQVVDRPPKEEQVLKKIIVK
ncbi:Transposase DDE domain protein [compost metagenome]